MQDVVISSGAVVGENVSVAQETAVGCRVVLQNCRIGKAGIIHPGVCIGQDGFGFYVDDNGMVVKKLQELQVGAICTIAKMPNNLSRSKLAISWRSGRIRASTGAAGETQWWETGRRWTIWFR